MYAFAFEAKRLFNFKEDKLETENRSCFKSFIHRQSHQYLLQLSENPLS